MKEFLLFIVAVASWNHTRRVKKLMVYGSISAVSSPKHLFTNREQGLNQSFSTCRRKGIIDGSRKFILQRKGKN